MLFENYFKIELNHYNQTSKPHFILKLNANPQSQLRILHP